MKMRSNVIHRIFLSQPLPYINFIGLTRIHCIFIIEQQPLRHKWECSMCGVLTVSRCGQVCYHYNYYGMHPFRMYYTQEC